MELPESTNPLRAAVTVQERAAEEQFDWPSLVGVWEKLQEEIRELQEAGDAKSRNEEVGDLLFMVVNLARHFGVDPVTALAGANQKFVRRFNFVLSHSSSFPPRGDPGRLAAMEDLWIEAKRRERAAALRADEAFP